MTKLDDISKDMKESVNKGRELILAIVLFNGILLLANFIIVVFVGTGSLGSFLLSFFWIFVFYMLYKGQIWAKWLFLIAAAIDALVLIFSLPYFGDIVEQGDAGLFLILDIVSGVAMIISAFVILLSASVKEFFYKQKPRT